MEKLYLVITAIGEVLLFLYGNMVSFMIFMLFTMGLHFIKEPTKHFMKKNLILLFLFGFCASNAPLLTYFKLRGYSKSFDLEYSIYIDIVIAVLGLIVTGYWEKLSKDEDENTTLMPVLAKWYKRAIELVLVLLAICFVFGSRGAKLKNTFGGKAVAGLATSLWKSISRSNGELWHVMEKYGVIGVAVMLVLGAIIFRRIMLMWESGELDALKKSYIIMAMMFLIQSFFFPFAASSTPVFMIFVGLAISGKYVFAVEEKEAVAATAAGPTSTIWLPGYVRTAMENVNKGADGSEDATGKGRSKAYINLAAYSFAAAMAATLLLLVAVAAYRLVAPNTQFGSDVESLVTDAKSKYDEKMLAASLEASNGEVDAASTASSEEEQLVAANDVSAVETSVASEEASDAASEATTDSELVPGIEAGVSGGDYRIYDPNAKYAEVDEDVSGKEGSVNLRSKPMVEGDVEVVHRLADGEMVKRIGIGENGWSKVVFEGQTLYAVTEYLITDTELARLEEERELAEEEADEVAEAPQEQAAAEAPAAATVDIASMPKGAGNYTVMYENDNKSIAIWSAGKLMGKMNVTDPDGTVQKLTDYGVFTSGSGKNQKRYLNIGSTNPTLPLTINVDAGFVAAVKNMGYSGIYFNKAVNNW